MFTTGTVERAADGASGKLQEHVGHRGLPVAFSGVGFIGLEVGADVVESYRFGSLGSPILQGLQQQVFHAMVAEQMIAGQVGSRKGGDNIPEITLALIVVKVGRWLQGIEGY